RFRAAHAHGLAVQRPLRRPRRTASSGGHGDLSYEESASPPTTVARGGTTTYQRGGDMDKDSWARQVTREYPSRQVAGRRWRTAQRRSSGYGSRPILGSRRGRSMRTAGYSRITSPSARARGSIR